MYGNSISIWLIYLHYIIYSIFPSSCNFCSQQHQPCEPIIEQNSNPSAISLDGTVLTLATRHCKNLESAVIREIEFSAAITRTCTLQMIYTHVGMTNLHLQHYVLALWCRDKSKAVEYQCDCMMVPVKPTVANLLCKLILDIVWCK